VNYLPRNRSKHPYLGKILILIAIFIFGAVALTILDETIIRLISPLWTAENAFSQNLRNRVAFLQSQKNLVEENYALKERLLSLETQIESFSKDRNERDALLELLGRRQDSEGVLAAVLTRPPQTPYDVILIDVGSNASITSGSEVSLPEGPILGTVSEVFSKKAKVKLFSTSGEETNAILERGSVPVILVGRGGGNFKITLSRDITVEKGDRILSADVFSRLLAVVEDVSVNSTDSFKEILAKSPANLFSLRFVFVTP